MQEVALRLVAIGSTGAFAQPSHALDAFVDIPGVFAARGESPLYFAGDHGWRGGCDPAAGSPREFLSVDWALGARRPLWV